MNHTQLFNPGDLERVKAIQAGYAVEPLSAFLEAPTPEAAPAIDYIEPLSREEIRESPKVGSGDTFGTREHLRNNYLYRMAAKHGLQLWAAGARGEPAVPATPCVDGAYELGE